MSCWKILIYIVLATLTNTEALPDKAELKRLFVDGQGGPKAAGLDQAHIDTIDRDLKITFDYPAMNLGSSMPSPWNETCGMDVSCPALKFDVTPGMNVTTADVRRFALTDAASAQTAITPTYSWTATAGKNYSFYMVDSLSPATMWNSGMLVALKQILHYAVFNIKGSDMSTGNATSPYRPPGNPLPQAPNVYAFMVFEHDEAITPSATSMMFDLKAHLAASGLGSAKLVAMNFFRAWGGPYSKMYLTSLGGQQAMMAAGIPCSSYTNPSAVYQNQTCLTGTTTGAGAAATTGVGQLTAGSHGLAIHHLCVIVVSIVTIVCACQL